jgi:hypothetical protein
MNRLPGDSSEIRSGTFTVGDLHVDAGQQCVRRAGSDIALPNLSFRLLVALGRAAPNVLSNVLSGGRVNVQAIFDTCCKVKFCGRPSSATINFQYPDLTRDEV